MHSAVFLSGSKILTPSSLDNHQLRLLERPLQVVGPRGPGAKDHDGAPDEHDEVDDGHNPTGHLVDSHANLLTAVNLPVSLSTLLVDLGPGVDGCEDEISMKTTLRVRFSHLQFETRRQIPATYSQ